MGALDKTVGALLLGSWANACLYVAELMQAARYLSFFHAEEAELKHTSDTWLFSQRIIP